MSANHTREAWSTTSAKTVPGQPPRPRLSLFDHARVAGVYLLVAVLAALAYTVREMLVLIFLGFFIALGVEPMVAWLRRHRWPRGLAVAAIVFGVLIVIGTLVLLAVVPAVRQLGQLAGQAPEVLSRLGGKFGNGTSLQAQLADPATQAQVKNAIGKLGSVLGKTLSAGFAAVGTFFGGMFAAVTTGALMVYFSLAMPRIHAATQRTAGTSDRAEAVQTALGRVGGYVTGQVMICACAGLVSFLFFLIAGVPYPFLLALVVAILDAIPQVGATLAALAGTLVALSQSVTLAVATLIFLLLYQAAENYLIAPRVFAKTVELSPLGAFVAILIGAALAGVLGALTALPIAAALKVLFQQALAERREMSTRLAAEEPAPPAKST